MKEKNNPMQYATVKEIKESDKEFDIQTELLNPECYEIAEGKSYLSVEEAREFLDNFDKDDVIVMASDEEGNNYSPLTSMSEVIYIPEDAAINDADDLEYHGYEYKDIKENVRNNRMKKAIVLFP